MRFSISSNVILVLIETYWNVKNCQGTPFGVGAQVLIETYWNVKTDDNMMGELSEVVLIETYWNIKYVELMAGFHALLY